jgi:hypothetical protein
MSFLRLADKPAREVELYLPWSGVPSGTVRFPDLVTLPAGQLTLRVGALELLCVVDEDASGAWASRSEVRVIGGAGGWRLAPPERTWQSDSGILASDVATATAEEVGETLAIDADADAQLEGAHFVRRLQDAATTLEQLFPDASWWVDPDGTTRVGTRTERDVTGKVELLEVDPRGRFAEVTAYDADLLLPGATISDARSSVPIVARDVEIRADATSARARLWTGRAPRRSVAADTMRRAVLSLLPELALVGTWRYRVIQQVGERLSLQVVTPRPGLPDAVFVPVAPGTPGLKALLALGSEVGVTFIDRDPSLPAVTHQPAASGAGWLPRELDADASDVVRVGATAELVELGSGDDDPSEQEGRVVRYGDVVTVGVATGSITTAGPVSRVRA